MTSKQQPVEPIIPDLRNISLETLAKLDDSVLANSIALYLQRLEQTGPQVNSFTSNI